MSRVDFFASERHYFDHISPIWAAMPEAIRGIFHVRPAIAPYATQKGISASTRLLVAADGQPVVVAGFADVRRAKGRPVILAEHGVGGRYKRDDGQWDRNPSNPGGSHRDAVRLFLCPNEDVAAANLEVYPDAKAAVVGCPRLDRWHTMRSGFENPHIDGGSVEGGEPCGMPVRSRLDDGGGSWAGSIQAANHPSGSPQREAPGSRGGQVEPTEPPPGDPVTIAIAFHWDNRQCPESRWALRHFVNALPTLASDVSRRYIREVRVLGHGHPRAWTRLERIYREAGIEPVQDVDEVFERASLLVCDNSSVLYEFASLGRPVVCMNAPWYRREVHHGLRFWSHVPGIESNDPARLPGHIAKALQDPPEAQALRSAAVERAYAHLDGRAAERAVRAIREVFG